MAECNQKVIGSSHCLSLLERSLLFPRCCREVTGANTRFAGGFGGLQLGRQTLARDPGRRPTVPVAKLFKNSSHRISSTILRGSVWPGGFPPTPLLSSPYHTVPCSLFSISPQQASFLPIILFFIDSTSCVPDNKHPLYFRLSNVCLKLCLQGGRNHPWHLALVSTPDETETGWNTLNELVTMVSHGAQQRMFATVSRVHR